MQRLRAWFSAAHRARIRWLPWSRFERIFPLVEPYTMLGPVRLERLYRGVRDVVARGVPGDVVECGVARGGSAATMGAALLDAGADRRLWLFDTFAGLPAPSKEKDPDYTTAVEATGECRGGIGEVRDLLAARGLADRSELVKGLFLDTLPAARCGTIAALHLDCDWYESVSCCLDHLYDRVSPGGFIQIDDYHHWQGCRKAVDEFFGKRGGAPKLHRLVGNTAVWMVKPAPPGPV